MRAPTSLLIAVLVSVAGCGTEKDEPRSAPPGSSPAATQSVASSVAASPSGVTGTGPDTTGFLAALQTVHPGLADKPPQALNRGLNVCLDIEQRKDAATVQANARARFETPDIKLTAEDAAQIVAAARSYLCPRA